MFKFGFKGEEQGQGGGSTLPPAPAPKVIKSEIYANNNKRIVVEWETPMKNVPDLRFAISISVDGGTLILPEMVTFNKKFMMLVMTNPLVAGQVITWTYDNSQGYRLASIDKNAQANGTIHSVDNLLVKAVAKPPVTTTPKVNPKPVTPKPVVKPATKPAATTTPATKPAKTTRKVSHVDRLRGWISGS